MRPHRFSNFAPVFHRASNAELFLTYRGESHVVGEITLHDRIEVRHGTVNRECVLVELREVARPKSQLLTF